jgi:hypothetical protein
MAIIDFQILGQNDGDPSLETLSGSGLGFFGLSAGSSVQIGAYQDTTYVSNGDGSVTKGTTNNIKYVADTHPSGMATVTALGGTYGTVGLSGIKSFESTLGVRFGHTTAVKTQNVQLRIYDRSNINYPASGVNTKVAEIVNFGGGTYDSQGDPGVGSNYVGSGDAFWWGEPWPAQYVTKNYFTNSLGTKFYNGTSADAVVNGDVRLGQVASDDETVGGSGLIVPLLDSPGSGQRGLDEVTGATGMIWPKWSQYILNTEQANWGGATMAFGDGTLAGNLLLNQGGTGYHTHHTWAVALSATPLNIGSKEQYGLYVSLEYL